MTKEEKAIQTLRTELACVRNVECERSECRNCNLVMPEHDIIEALELAISALSQPQGDLISREDALLCLTGEIKETDTIETIIAQFVRRIRKLPSVNPQNCNKCEVGNPCLYCKHEFEL